MWSLFWCQLEPVIKALDCILLNSKFSCGFFLLRTLCLHQWVPCGYRRPSFWYPEAPNGPHRRNLHLGRTAWWPYIGLSLWAVWHCCQSNLFVEFTRWSLQEGVPQICLCFTYKINACHCYKVVYKCGRWRWWKCLIRITILCVSSLQSLASRILQNLAKILQVPADIWQHQSLDFRQDILQSNPYNGLS